MKKSTLIHLLIAVLVAPMSAAMAAPEPREATAPLIEFERAAVAPFLVGQRQPEMDETKDRTLTCTIEEICVNDPNIAPHAGITLTRLTDEYLRLRFGDQTMVRREAVDNAYGALALNQAEDSPRSLAMKLGKILDVHVVFVGTVWRFRDRGAISAIPDSPPSVAFAVYLIDVQTGRSLWRGIYSITQQPVSDNLFKAKEQLKLGLKWRTAGEIAQIGVREIFADFNPMVRP